MAWARLWSRDPSKVTYMQTAHERHSTLTLGVHGVAARDRRGGLPLRLVGYDLLRLRHVRTVGAASLSF